MLCEQKLRNSVSNGYQMTRVSTYYVKLTDFADTIIITYVAVLYAYSTLISLTVICVSDLNL